MTPVTYAMPMCWVRSVRNGVPTTTANLRARRADPSWGNHSRELTDVLVVVVRYFGGILLGTSRLIAAYKEAAADALEQATVVERTVERQVAIRFEYP